MDYRAEGAQAPDLSGVLDLLHRSDLPLTGVTEHFRNFLVVRDEAPPAVRDTWEFRSGCPSSSAFMRRSL